MENNPAAIERTRQEWRELGFYYDCDDQSKVWRILGSKAGLLAFAQLLRDYTEDSRNALVSEHEHYGPYYYLEIGTWPTAEITDHWIAGPLECLAELGRHIQAEVSSLEPGSVMRLRSVFAPDAPYELQLEVQSDDFDPAGADEGCAVDA
ncbi:MAG: hypothetical protein QM766_03610 [Burkholderiaceae bacterium]